jgi:hypothetical protein
VALRVPPHRLHGHAGSPSASFGSQSCAAPYFAGFFVIFAPSHFLFDAAAFHQFPKAPHGILNTFPFPYDQANHSSSFNNR